MVVLDEDEEDEEDEDDEEGIEEIGERYGHVFPSPYHIAHVTIQSLPNLYMVLRQGKVKNPAFALLYTGFMS